MAVDAHEARLQADGGPISPEDVVVKNNMLVRGRMAKGYMGLSVRDWFAGQALQGLLANIHGPTRDKGELVQSAYSYADLMLQNSNAQASASRTEA